MTNLSIIKILPNRVGNIYIKLKSIGIALGKTLFNIVRRSLSKRRYLSFETKNQKIVNFCSNNRLIKM